MKLTISKRELNEAVQHVSKAISGKTTLQILTGIKLDVTSDQVTLTASDIDTTIQAFIPITAANGKEMVTVEEPGCVVLPAKFLVEIIKKLPKETVEIEVGEGFNTRIKSGRTDIELAGMDPQEYPAAPAVDDELTFRIAGSKLKELIRSTVFAVSTNEQSPILTGVLWNLDGARLKLLATDRHRLASTVAVIDAPEDMSFHNIVIAAKTLNELVKIISDQESVEISIGRNQVLFNVGAVHFYSRLLDGNYPDTTKIIPTNFKSELDVGTKAFGDALDRAYLLAREEKTNIVRLQAGEDGAVEITSASSGVGKVLEQLEAEKFTGDPLRISFNSKYMLDALKVIDSEQLHIGFTGTMSPIIIRPGDGKESLYLILPYRTSN
ncbi:DNA polymerase III subunit beta [Paenibacillus faecis]|uniref:Beta sliding clamp n=1 Tax=Paenibacillus faecis TaxID=862114 RepID=A0A5D0CP35_9BACL|nr:DNA polymerase III subunit beta [Paenibacillus faecis]TYA10965.1 DNA polymerase III subunit beta [Paenibacillus faecis]